MSARTKVSCVGCDTMVRSLSCSRCGLSYCRRCLKDHAPCHKNIEEMEKEYDFLGRHGFSGLVGWVEGDGLARVTLVGVSGVKVSKIMIEKLP